MGRENSWRPPHPDIARACLHRPLVIRFAGCLLTYTVCLRCGSSAWLLFGNRSVPRKAAYRLLRDLFWLDAEPGSRRQAERAEMRRARQVA